MYRCVLVSRVFQFHHYQRDAVHEEYDIGPFVYMVFYDGVLIDDKEFIFIRILKVWMQKVSPKPGLAN